MAAALEIVTILEELPMTKEDLEVLLLSLIGSLYLFMILK